MDCKNPTSDILCKTRSVGECRSFNVGDRKVKKQLKCGVSK